MKIFAHIRWFISGIGILIGMTYMILSFRFYKQPHAVKAGSRLISFIMGLKATVKGSIHPQTQMFIINHQSDIDIGIMEGQTDMNIAWVAKKEIGDIPFFGNIVKLHNDILIERESKSSLVKLIKEVKDRLDSGRVIAIFPEGTRSKTGKMLPWKPGTKLVANKYNLRIQPVVISQSAYHFDLSSKTAHSGTIRIQFLDSFIASKENKSWYEDLEIKMQKAYDDDMAEHSSNR